MRDISFRDMKNVLWAATFKLAGLRSLASAIVLSIAGVLLGLFQGVGQFTGFFLFWLLGSTIGGVGNLYMVKAISTLASPFTGGITALVCTLMSYLIALMLASGDPLIYALKGRFPELVPSKFGPLNLRAIIFVLDEDFDAASVGDEGIEADPSVV